MALRTLAIDGGVADEIRRSVDRGRGHELADLTVTEIDLGAALELACAAAEWSRDGSPAVRIVDMWTEHHAPLREARRGLIGVSNSPENVHSSPQTEIRTVPSRDDIAGTAWSLFLQRFTRGLRGPVGLNTQLAHGVAAAFGEMVDNVLQHSTPFGTTSGVVGYQIGPRRFSFAVADLGIGVLASLRENPKWHSLGSSVRALDAAVRKNATRRTEFAEGNGFKTVLRNLADMNATLRFRSGDGLLTLDGRHSASVARLRAVESTGPHMGGTQVSVRCQMP